MLNKKCLQKCFKNFLYFWNKKILIGSFFFFQFELGALDLLQWMPTGHLGIVQDPGVYVNIDCNKSKVAGGKKSISKNIANFENIFVEHKPWNC